MKVIPITSLIPPRFSTEVFLRSQKSEQSYIYVFRISFLLLFAILIFDFETLPTVWYVLFVFLFI
jgi:hypothetical protein